YCGCSVRGPRRSRSRGWPTALGPRPGCLAGTRPLLLLAGRAALALGGDPAPADVRAAAEVQGQGGQLLGVCLGERGHLRLGLNAVAILPPVEIKRGATVTDYPQRATHPPVGWQVIERPAPLAVVLDLGNRVVVAAAEFLPEQRVSAVLPGWQALELRHRH